MYVSGIDEILYLNEEEFKEILSKWQKCNLEISQLQSDSNYQEEFISFKGFIKRKTGRIKQLKQNIRKEQ